MRGEEKKRKIENFLTKSLVFCIIYHLGRYFQNIGRDIGSADILPAIPKPVSQAKSRIGTGRYRFISADMNRYRSIFNTMLNSIAPYEFDSLLTKL